MATKYFCKDTNDDGTCDLANSPLDLDQTMGSTATQASSNTTNEAGFDVVMSFDEDIASDNPGDGTHDVSVDINSMSGDAELKFRVRLITNLCSAVASSGYGATLTSADVPVVHTFTTASLTLGAANRLRLSCEMKRDSGAHGNKSFNMNVNDVDSWVNAPWTPAAGDDLIAQARATHRHVDTRVFGRVN